MEMTEEEQSMLIEGSVARPALSSSGTQAGGDFVDLSYEMLEDKRSGWYMSKLHQLS